jgi:hypothetical protein
MESLPDDRRLLSLQKPSRIYSGDLFIYLQIFKHGNISTIALKYLKVVIQVKKGWFSDGRVSLIYIS